jgi:hypothetical protein
MEGAFAAEVRLAFLISLCGDGGFDGRVRNVISKTWDKMAAGTVGVSKARCRYLLAEAGDELSKTSILI